jgi:hypothetical protein
VTVVALIVGDDTESPGIAEGVESTVPLIWCCVVAGGTAATGFGLVSLTLSGADVATSGKTPVAPHAVVAHRKTVVAMARVLVDNGTKQAYNMTWALAWPVTHRPGKEGAVMRFGSRSARVSLVVTAVLTAGVVVGDVGGQVAHAAQLTRMQSRLLSGTAVQALVTLQASAAVLGEDNAGEDVPDGAAAGVTPGVQLSPGAPSRSGNIIPGRNGTCQVRQGNNVRVNDDCQNATDTDLHGRAQAQNETSIAVNPTDPSNLIASANDYRRGDGGCGTYYSVDNARTWNGGVAPSSFIRGGALTGTARTYFQAGGDTDVAFDSKGVAYLQCQVFNRGLGVSQDPDLSSAILLFRSDNKGASWNFPGRVVVASTDPATSGVIVEDKPFMAIDSNPASPFADRIYITWTVFTTDGAAYIYESWSSDAGETFSPPMVIGGDSATLCPNTFGVPTTNGSCNENQFSYPFVGPDGSVYVVWANFNNAVSGLDNRNQVLFVKSTDGGATFGPVSKAVDYYDVPDCLTYTGLDAGRSCVPNKSTTNFNSVFRVANYPTAVVDPTDPSRLVVHIGSYINSNSNEGSGCVPQGFSPTTFLNLFTGVLTPACHNQVIESVSGDAGASFSGQTTDPRKLPIVGSQRRVADEFFQSTAASSDGVVVSYYDRQYGNDDVSGFNDVSITFGDTTKRVTTASSPPVTQFAGTFMGDYIRMAVSGSTAYPSWSDTRLPGVTTCPADPRALCQFGQDEDIFTARIELHD